MKILEMLSQSATYPASIDRTTLENILTCLDPQNALEEQYVAFIATLLADKRDNVVGFKEMLPLYSLSDDLLYGVVGGLSPGYLKILSDAQASEPCFTEAVLDRMNLLGLEWQVFILDPERFKNLSEPEQQVLVDKPCEDKQLPIKLYWLLNIIQSNCDLTIPLKQAFHVLSTQPETAWVNRGEVESLMLQHPDHYAWCDEEMDKDMSRFLQLIKATDPVDYDALKAFLNENEARNQWLCGYLRGFHPCPGDDNELCALVIQTLFEQGEGTQASKRNIKAFLSRVCHAEMEDNTPEEKKAYRIHKWLHCLSYSSNGDLQAFIIKHLEILYPSEFKGVDWHTLSLEEMCLTDYACLRGNKTLLTHPYFFPDELDENERMIRLIKLETKQHQINNAPIPLRLTPIDLVFGRYMALYPDAYRLNLLMSSTMAVEMTPHPLILGLQIAVTARQTYFKDLLSYPRTFKAVYTALTPDDKIKVLRHITFEKTSFLVELLQSYNSHIIEPQEKLTLSAWLLLLFEGLSEDSILSFFKNEEGGLTEFADTLLKTVKEPDFLLGIPSIKTLTFLLNVNLSLLTLPFIARNALLRKRIRQFDLENNQALYKHFNGALPTTIAAIILRLLPREALVDTFSKPVKALNVSILAFYLVTHMEDCEQLFSGLNYDELKRVLDLEDEEGNTLFHECIGNPPMLEMLFEKLSREEVLAYLTRTNIERESAFRLALLETSTYEFTSPILKYLTKEERQQLLFNDRGVIDYRMTYAMRLPESFQLCIDCIPADHRSTVYKQKGLVYSLAQESFRSQASADMMLASLPGNEAFGILIDEKALLKSDHTYQWWPEDAQAISPELQTYKELCNLYLTYQSNKSSGIRRPFFRDDVYRHYKRIWKKIKQADSRDAYHAILLSSLTDIQIPVVVKKLLLKDCLIRTTDIYGNTICVARGITLLQEKWAQQLVDTSNPSSQQEVPLASDVNKDMAQCFQPTIG